MYVQNEAGESLIFQFGDGGGPETFTAAASINTDRKLELSADVFTGQVPNTDPSKPHKTIRRVKATDIRFTGAGVADMPSFKTLRDLWKAAAPFNGKVIQDADNGWTLTGPWVIESLSIGGVAKEDQTFDITLAQADELTWTDDA